MTEKLRGHAELCQQDLERQPALCMMNLTHRHVRTACGREAGDWRTSGFSSKLNTLIREVTENLEQLRAGRGRCQKVYDFIWDTYCDWYIELTKARLYGEDEAAQGARLSRCCAMC